MIEKTIEVDADDIIVKSKKGRDYTMDLEETIECIRLTMFAWTRKLFFFTFN